MESGATGLINNSVEDPNQNIIRVTLKDLQLGSGSYIDLNTSGISQRIMWRGVTPPPPPPPHTS